jgi:acetylornithine deacetylase/succinyl-diaminopimelate desuccinylase-like protein
MAGAQIQAQSKGQIHTAELLQNLIRFNTVNPPGNEIECIKYIDHLLKEYGISTIILARDPQRPNLISRIPGRGNAHPLLIYGHVDVVPVENQVWKYPPFEGKIIDGQVWGRGALDMKGGVAMMLAALLRAKEENLALPGDVIFVALSDEETLGEFGAKYLVENHAEIFKGVRYAIGEFGGSSLYVGNKKFYPIMVSEKQICGVLAHIHGPTGHATIPMRGGAMARLGRILQKLDQPCLPVHITPITRQMIQIMANNLSFPTNLIINQLLNPRLTDRMLKVLGSKGQILDPILRNTVNAMLVKGGEHIGQIPKEVMLHMACPLLPGYGKEDILSELQPLMGEAVEMEITHYEPVSAEPDMGLFETLTGILREADPEGTPSPMILPAPTDGHTFSRLGIQTYGFLPMDIPPGFDFWQLLHAPDERIPVKALNFGTEAIYTLFTRFGN